MNSREHVRWAAVRRRGQARYLVLQGIVLYALPISLVNAVVLWQLAYPAWLHAVVAPLWLLGGLLFAHLMWRINEWRYRQPPRSRRNRVQSHR